MVIFLPFLLEKISNYLRNFIICLLRAAHGKLLPAIGCIETEGFHYLNNEISNRAIQKYPLK
jgi:hypothetical protein